MKNVAIIIYTSEQPKYKKRQKDILDTWGKDLPYLYFVTDNSVPFQETTNKLAVTNLSDYPSHMIKNMMSIKLAYFLSIQNKYDFFLILGDDNYVNIDALLNDIQNLDPLENCMWGQQSKNFSNYILGGSGPLWSKISIKSFFEKSIIIGKQDISYINSGKLFYNEHIFSNAMVDNCFKLLNHYYSSDVCVGLCSDYCKIKKIHRKGYNSQPPTEQQLKNIKEEIVFHYIGCDNNITQHELHTLIKGTQ